MARIYIDARNITEDPSGIATYAKSLISQLIEKAPEHRFKVIRHSSNQKPIFESTPNLDEIFVDLHIDRVPNFLFGHRKLGAIFKNNGKPDLYHSLFHIIPRGLNKSTFDFPILTTLHDLIWIDHPEQSQTSWLEAKAIEQFGQRAIPATLKIADHVISVSEPTRQRAAEWIDLTKTRVISHGVESEFFDPPKPETFPINGFKPHRKTVTAVGNDKDYKNLKRLVMAFSLLDLPTDESQLVLVGPCQGLEPVIDAVDIPREQIFLPGFVDKQRLLDILSLTDLFVFPSLIEGFGLPIIEAMAAGLPVMTSNLEPMRTVGGDAAVLFDPRNTEQMASKIRGVLKSHQKRKQLSDKSREHASKFRWPTTASETLNLYKNKLGLGSSQL